MIQKKILLVEDDTAIRELLADILKTEGFVVYTAENGSEGLKHLKEKQTPDLILMDLMMPVMDGRTFRLEVLKNKEWAKIPAIVMSAESNVKDKLSELNITDFLYKPVNLDKILKTISCYI